MRPKVLNSKSFVLGGFAGYIPGTARQRGAYVAVSGVSAPALPRLTAAARATRRLVAHGHRSGTGRGRRAGRPVWPAASLVALSLGLIGLTACAPPNSPAGSGDGGVTVGSPTATGTASAVAAPIDVALTDTKGLDGSMALTPFATTAPAGDVTFNVKNLGTVDHEMIVLKTDTPFDQIPVADSGDPPAPVTTGADKVDEANNIGETGDPNLKPGDTRTFTIKNLAPGHYVFVCNLAKHYGLGMRAAFTVS